MKKTGRIHTVVSSAVAATADYHRPTPNLQNIPIRSAEGRKIRQAIYRHPAGYKIMAADYSQIGITHHGSFIRRSGLVNAFSEGLDVQLKQSACRKSLAWPRIR